MHPPVQLGESARAWHVDRGTGARAWSKAHAGNDANDHVATSGGDTSGGDVNAEADDVVLPAAPARASVGMHAAAWCCSDESDATNRTTARIEALRDRLTLRARRRSSAVRAETADGAQEAPRDASQRCASPARKRLPRRQARLLGRSRALKDASHARSQKITPLLRGEAASQDVKQKGRADKS